MKRILATALAATILVTPATAFAEPIALPNDQPSRFSLMVTSFETPNILLPSEATAEPEPVVYTVVQGDNLIKIGTAYNVEWQRLWAKNTQLKHPDIIDVGDKITIPSPDEELDRALPATVSLSSTTPGVVSRGTYTAGNTYDYGQCTWHVKNMRGASLPNRLGNANMWYYNAQSMGMAVGSTPRVGAVATTTAGRRGHVAFVERVNADGTIYISHMNAPAWGVVSHRTAQANEFLYIY